MNKAFKHSLKGKRNKNDFYPTHHSLVWQLMEKLKIPEEFLICDPAAGENDIVSALMESGIENNMFFTDISKGDDFLIDNKNYDVIFTNPPFSIANVFIEKAFQVANEMVVMLLPLDYLHGSKRYNIFYKNQKDFYLSEIYCFVRRPMFLDCVREDGKYNTGSVTFSWLVWRKITGDFPEPVFRWIDNSEYVIGSRNIKTDNNLKLDMF